MKKIIAALLGVFLMIGLAGAAEAVSKPKVSSAKARTPKLIHPCDLNGSGRQDSYTENLCVKVWGQDSYTITHRDGSSIESPAGPVVAIELITWEREEDAGILELQAAFRAEIRQYAKRDRV